MSLILICFVIGVAIGFGLGWLRDRLRPPRGRMLLVTLEVPRPVKKHVAVHGAQS